VFGFEHPDALLGGVSGEKVGVFAVLCVLGTLDFLDAGALGALTWA
jgi:uncharacterized membrane-anchored protein